MNTLLPLRTGYVAEALGKRFYFHGRSGLDALDPTDRFLEDVMHSGLSTHDLDYVVIGDAKQPKPNRLYLRKSEWIDSSKPLPVELSKVLAEGGIELYSDGKTGIIEARIPTPGGEFLWSPRDQPYTDIDQPIIAHLAYSLHRGTRSKQEDAAHVSEPGENGLEIVASVADGHYGNNADNSVDLYSLSAADFSNQIVRSFEERLRVACSLQHKKIDPHRLIKRCLKEAEADTLKIHPQTFHHLKKRLRRSRAERMFHVYYGLYRELGATFVSVIKLNGRYHIIHMGDTFAYLIRDNAKESRSLTQPHLWERNKSRFIQDDYRRFGIPMNSVLGHVYEKRLFAGEFKEDPTIIDYYPKPGDRYLVLSSDGLAAINPEDMTNIILNSKNLFEARMKLIKTRRDAEPSYVDNISIIILPL